MDRNPFDNYARLRLSEIWILEERNLADAKKLLQSIKKSDPKFMVSEILEFLGDLECLDQAKNYE